MNPQMKKGILEMCTLYLIAQEDMYGYDILKSMKLRFPEISESAFYAILRRINAGGYTDVYYKEPTKGPRRKYYKITDEGRRELERQLRDWQHMKQSVASFGIEE